MISPSRKINEKFDVNEFVKFMIKDCPIFERQTKGSDD